MPVKVAATSVAISWIPKRALVGMSGLDTPLSAGLLPWSVAPTTLVIFLRFSQCLRTGLISAAPLALGCGDAERCADRELGVRGNCDCSALLKPRDGCA
jgi:hypothetical protein